MHVTYTPEDGDRQEWDFDPRRVRQAAGELIEKRYGGKWPEWRADVVQGGLRARRVLLWHLLWRDHPTLRYEDSPDFMMFELEVELDSSEVAEMRDAVEKADVDEETRSSVLVGLSVAMADALAREAAAGKALEGTAPSSESAATTPA